MAPPWRHGRGGAARRVWEEEDARSVSAGLRAVARASRSWPQSAASETLAPRKRERRTWRRWSRWRPLACGKCSPQPFDGSMNSPQAGQDALPQTAFLPLSPCRPQTPGIASELSGCRYPALLAGDTCPRRGGQRILKTVSRSDATERPMDIGKSTGHEENSDED
jgi:hypothetical protein